MTVAIFNNKLMCKLLVTHFNITLVILPGNEVFSDLVKHVTNNYKLMC